MLKKETLRKEIFLISYIFLLLFSPPLVKEVNILLFLFTFSSVVILIKYRKDLKEVFLKKEIQNILFAIIIYFVYYIGCIIINGVLTKSWYFYNYIINIYTLSLVFICTTVCVLHITLYCRKNNISFNKIIEFIIIAGLLQSMITIATVLVPSIKEFFIKIMYLNTSEKLYLNKYFIERRAFGFANNLLDSFGYGTGIIATLPLFYSLKNGKCWLFTVPFLLLVPMLNSRTGLVVFVIGFIIWSFYILKNKLLKNYLDILLVSIVFVLIGVVGVNIVSPKTIQWIVGDILSFFSDKKGTADVLFGENFWKLPDFINCIFGTGYNIVGHAGMKETLGFTSDVGYINEIWKVGFVGILMLFGIFVTLIKSTHSKLPKEYTWFIIAFVFETLIANIKFSVISYNPGIVILFIVLLMNLLKKEDEIKEELVSVIVPVYNVENYLKKCIDSIINQTYKNLEIILVNDGSTDNSEQICLDYMKTDKRIKYIKQKNQGLSAARNKGIEESTGKYYVFVDSDDYVNINFIKELYFTLINNQADIAMCEYTKVYENEEYDTSKKQEGIIQVFEGKQKLNNLYNEKSVVTTVAWNKIYKKEIFEKVRYSVGKLHEDEFIILDLLNIAKRIAYTSCEYYYYLQRNNSITGNYNLRRMHILEALEQRMDFFKENKIDKLYAYTLYNYYYQLIYHYTMIKKNYSNEIKIIEEIIYKINKLKKEVLLNIYIHPLKKLKLLIKLTRV